MFVIKINDKPQVRQRRLLPTIQRVKHNGACAFGRRSNIGKRRKLRGIIIDNKFKISKGRYLFFRLAKQIAPLSAQQRLRQTSSKYVYKQKRSESNLQTVFLLLKCARLQRLLNASAKSRGLFRTLCLKSVKRSKNVVGLRARGGIVAAKPIVVAI